MTWEEIRQRKEDSIRESTGNPMSKSFEVNGKTYSSYTEYSNSDEYKEFLSAKELVLKEAIEKYNNIALEKFKYSLQRLLSLLEIVNYCTVDSIKYLLNDNQINLKTNKIIKLKKSFFSNFLNIKEYNSLIFKKLGFKIVCQTKNELYFLIPNIRKDIERPIDIIEEYAKYLGYDNFENIIPVKQIYFKNV